MTWFAVDDRFPTHSKVYELRQHPCHDSALALWLLAGAWCAGQDGHNFTGFVPTHMLNAFGISTPQEAAQALCDVLLWEHRDGGYWFHDWANWNGPDAKHNRSKEQTRARTQAWRIRLCEEAGDDLTKHDAHCPTTDMNGNPRSCPRRALNDLGADSPSQPAPSRPEVTSPGVTLTNAEVQQQETAGDVTQSELSSFAAQMRGDVGV